MSSLIVFIVVRVENRNSHKMLLKVLANRKSYAIPNYAY